MMYPNVFTEETHAAHFKNEWERVARRQQLGDEAGEAVHGGMAESRGGLSRLAARLTDAARVNRVVPWLRGLA